MRFCVFWIKICRKVISLLYCMKYSEKRKKEKHHLSYFVDREVFKTLQNHKTRPIKNGPFTTFLVFWDRPIRFHSFKENIKGLASGELSTIIETKRNEDFTIRKYLTSSTGGDTSGLWKLWILVICLLRHQGRRGQWRHTHYWPMMPSIASWWPTLATKGPRCPIFVFKAAFTLGHRALLPGHGHKIVLCSDTGYPICC